MLRSKCKHGMNACAMASRLCLHIKEYNPTILPSFPACTEPGSFIALKRAIRTLKSRSEFSGIKNRKVNEYPESQRSGNVIITKRRNNKATRIDSFKNDIKNVHILGAGIAGLSTARYLLSQTQHLKNLHVTIIDRNVDIPSSLDEISSVQSSEKIYDKSSSELMSLPSTLESYVQQQMKQPHFSIPSRRNGNMLCPSLTVPWTSRSVWKEAISPSLKSLLGFERDHSSKSSVSFDWKYLATDRSMWSFATHFLLQKLFLGRPEHQTNKPILDYNMKCLCDPSDDLIQSIEYGRWAKGTKLLDGTIKDMDSSGDIGLFCQGLLQRLLLKYGERFTVIRGEEAVMLEVDDKKLRGVTTIDQNGRRITRETDKAVVALGVESSSLCRTIGVPCPVYPAKGHLVTISSTIDCPYNITLPGGIGYAAPMSNTCPNNRRLYRLSGFVDFTPVKHVNQDRIEALVEAARVPLPDLEVIDSSSCHRPISADDRPIIGPTHKYPNLFLCTGLGSRGWSVGLGSGKLLSCQILGRECESDHHPYLPDRFRLAG